MATGSLSQSGLQGLREATVRADGAAQRIVKAGASGDVTDLTAALVDMQVARSEAAASAKVVDVSGRTLGTLIDVLA